MSKFIYYLGVFIFIITLLHQAYYFQQLHLANNLYFQKKYQEALNIYEDVEGKIIYFPPLIYLRRAEILERKCDIKGATYNLEKYLLVYPDNTQERFNLASLYYQQNKGEEAISELRKVILRQENFAQAHNLLFLLLYEGDDLKGALFHAERYYQIKPTEEILRDIELMNREMYFSRDLKKIESKNFTIKYYPTLDYHAPYFVLQILEEIYSRTYGFLNFTPDKILVKIFDIPTFDKIISSPSSNVFAIVINNKLLIKSPGVIASFDDLKSTITHEYLHLLLHKITRGKIPTWLNEGVAEFFSEGDISPTQKKLLQETLLQNELFPFEDLQDNWKLSGKKLSLAYLQSRSLISFLVKEFGIKKLTEIIHLLSCDKTVNTALFLSLGMDFNQLQNRWRGYLIN